MIGRANSVTCLITAVSLFSCTKTETIVVTTPVGEEFEVNLDQYSMTHYFVDTSYIPLYEQYYQSPVPLVNPPSQIVEAEVWIQRQGPSTDPDDRLGVAWLSLPPRPSDGYDSTYRTYAPTVGSVEYTRFYRVDPWSYTLEADGYVGVLSLILLSPPPDVVFAIAYRRADGSQFGDFLENGFVDSTGTLMVLKMVKPTNLFSTGPLYPVAWQMLLKNFYYVHFGPTHVSRTGFELGIFRTSDSGQDESAILGHPLLRVLGLDSYANGEPSPDGDGLFDFRPGLTINQTYGEIFFPTLKPLDDGIDQYFTGRGLPVPDSSFHFPELYDTTLTVAQQSPRNRYLMRGRGIFD